MDPRSTERQKFQSPLFPRIELLDVAANTLYPAPDELSDAVLVMNPEDSVQSKISEEMLGRILS